MMNTRIYFLLLVLCVTSGCRGATYSLKEDVVGHAFYSHFDWEAVADPNHGRINYVDQETSISENLTFASSDTFVLRTDYKTVLDPIGPGRNSVRIRSKNNYTTHVAVFDLRHMPQGCGTWPGIKETKESDKPKGGLIDIIEGINDQPPNSITLHTTAGCTMPATRPETGISGQLDCNVAVNSNTGCGVTNPGASDYGPEFNENAGGWYAIERATNHISLWFWSRQNSNVPLDVKHGLHLVDPSTWGTPVAYFPDTTCSPMSQFFEEHNIIINLTLCGDWAGNDYQASGCPSTCIDYVNNNPTAFMDAYFDFAAVRIYEPLITIVNQSHLAANFNQILEERIATRFRRLSSYIAHGAEEFVNETYRYVPSDIMASS